MHCNIFAKDNNNIKQVSEHTRQTLHKAVCLLNIQLASCSNIQMDDMVWFDMQLKNYFYANIHLPLSALEFVLTAHQSENTWYHLGLQLTCYKQVGLPHVEDIYRQHKQWHPECKCFTNLHQCPKDNRCYVKQLFSYCHCPEYMNRKATSTLLY
jgi:hypothetical protein